MKRLSLFLASLLLCGVTLGAEERRLSAENTTIKFVGSKKDGKHEGTFKKLDGTLVVDAADMAKSNLELTIDVASMTTDAEKLTAHLKSPDFFNVKRFPHAKFVSKSISPRPSAEGQNGYTVAGELTMLGRTNPVTFPATAATSGGTATISAQFEIKRSDWGMNYGMDRVNDAVQLALEVKLPAESK